MEKGEGVKATAYWLQGHGQERVFILKAVKHYNLVPLIILLLPMCCFYLQPILFCSLFRTDHHQSCHFKIFSTVIKQLLQSSSSLSSIKVYKSQYFKKMREASNLVYNSYLIFYICVQKISTLDL